MLESIKHRHRLKRFSLWGFLIFTAIIYSCSNGEAELYSTPQESINGIEGGALVKVAYNSSGQILRAARTTANVLMDDGCYYYIAQTADEAAYLTALLNSPCLQVAFQQALRSGRDFHLHIWEEVPIPCYDNNSADHAMLAALCKEAEAAASGVVRSLSARTGQIKASSEIRRELMTSGIANRIDEVVRRIMPKYSHTKYDEARPHPWNTRQTRKTR